MNELENELRGALRRTDAPPGFADRVMARIPEKGPRTRGFFRFFPLTLRAAWVPAIAVLLLVALWAGSWEYNREHARRQAAERAKADLIFALQVTSAKLHTARTRLMRHSGGNI